MSTRMSSNSEYSAGSGGFQHKRFLNFGLGPRKIRRETSLKNSSNQRWKTAKV
jgi:hypothetical protein